MSRERLYAVLSVVLTTVIAVVRTHATPPPNFQNETMVASGLSFPTALEFLPDGRMLVSEFGGRVKIVQPGGTSVDPTPVLQLVNVINENVTGGGERGLVNVIADPNFAGNGFIYLFYTAGNPQRDRVSRFTMQGNTASLATELVIWQGVDISDSTDHHGGGMFFGLDGKLYIATGDNGDASSSQNLRSDHGKVLRVNADGTVPTDNPFYDGNGQNIDAIWALGLRNPFRMSQDPVTGRIYFGDVGFNSVEEVNLVTRGANYGWPVCEGPCGNAGMSNPIYSWNRVGRDGASLGGFVYRGAQYPSSYQGVYFYADYAQNWIRYLTMDAQGNVTGSVNFEPADGTLDSPQVGDPVMLKPGPEGAIYYIDLGLSWAGGGVGGTHVASIRRLRYTAVNQPPVVNISANPASGPVPLVVNFSSAGSTDPEGQPLFYSWTFGDGGTSTAANPTHNYQQTGLFTVRLALSDGVNVTQSGALFVAAGNQPFGVITTPTDGAAFRAGDVIGFAGTGTDIEDGNLGAEAFAWSVLFHHDSHIHPTLGPLLNVTSGSFVVPNMGHDFGGETGYEIVLRVTDSDGLPHESSVLVYPEKVNLSFNTVPSGLALEIDGITRTTPFVKDTLIGFIHQINAPNQSSGTSNFTFTSWSNGGPQSQFLTVPASAASYTAFFQTVVNPLPAGLVVNYGFSEGSGTAVADSSGQGHTGSLLNGPTWITGKYGGGVSLDGVNDFIQVGNPSTLNFGTSDFTIAVWVRREATGAEHTIFSKSANSSWTSGGKELFISGANNRLGFGAWGIGEAYSTGTIVNDGQWHHVVVTFVNSSDRVDFYIDGAASGNGTVNAPADDSSHVIKLGGHPAGHTFRGALDEFRVYNRALSASEVVADRDASAPPPVDTTAPVISNGQPSGTLPAGTTQTQISVRTDENATARYSTVPGTAYAAMTGTFTVTGGTNHSAVIGGLVNGASYTLYVKAVDGAGNITANDYPVSFSVASPPPPDTTPPTLSNGQPTGTLAAGTTQTTLTVRTDENATARFSTVAGTPYASMTGAFTTTGGTNHSTLVGGLVNGANYAIYVKAIDGSGNISPNDYVISFSVASPPPPDVTAPTVSLTSPADGATVTGTISVAAVASDNIGVVGVHFLLDGVNLGAEDTVSPYSVSWNTTAASAGAHTLIARARDAAGNLATSAVVTVTVPVSSGPAGRVTALAFSEGTGTTVADGSGQGHTGTLVNGPTWVAGKYGGGVSLDGVNDFVQVANPSTLNLGTSDFTLSVWVRREATGSENTILSKTASSSWSSGGKELFISGANDRVGFGAWGIGEAYSTGTIVNDGQWHHVAVTFVDGANRIDFFLDGVASGGGTVNLPADDGTHVIKLGGHPAGHTFRGALDEFRVYNRVLSAAEIVSDRDTTGTPPPTDTTAPTLSNGQPSGPLPAGTTQTTLSVRTDENATARYSTVAGTPYGAMTGAFSTTGGTNHSALLGGLVNGASYTIYVKAMDGAGNITASDYLVSFSVASPPPDTTAPVLSNGQPTGTLPLGTTQTTLSVRTDENATARYSTVAGTPYGAMTGTFSTTGGTNHSTLLGGLVNGASYTIYVKAIDGAGNITASDYLVSFSVASPPPDTTAPVLSNGQPTGTLPLGTTQTTLSVRTDENAMARYSTVAGTPYGSMTGTFSTTGGTNHSTLLGGLVNGASYTIYVKAMDGAGNITAIDYLVSFSVASPGDTTAPTISNGQPSGTLAAGTTQASLFVSTDESATCRFSTTAGVPYGSMTNAFGSTGGTSHTTLVNGLVNGATYTIYVKAIDGAGNATVSDYVISFSVASPPADTTAPILSNGQPTGTLAAGTTQTTLSVRTDENATARYSTVPGTAYASMAGSFSTTGGTNHSTLLSGLANGASYTIYVKAMDVAGNVTSSDYLVSFSVAVPPDTTAPTVSLSSPADGGTVTGTVSVTANASDNLGVVGVQFLLDGANLGAEDTGAPYSVNWNTATASPGTHQLAARARDAAGNMTTSATITVTVPALEPTGQVVLLAFSEGTGTTVADNSGQGHPGSLVNGPTWIGGRYGNAVSLDGVNDHVLVSNPNSLNFGTSDFTVAVWVRREATGAEHTLFSKAATSSWNAGGKEFFINASNSRLGFGAQSAGEVFSNGSVVNDGQWHHVVVTFVDGSNQITFYIDGVASGGGVVNLPADKSNHVVKLGGHPVGHTFRGGMDEFRVYNRALSPTEIQTIMNRAIAP